MLQLRDQIRSGEIDETTGCDGGQGGCHAVQSDGPCKQRNRCAQDGEAGRCEIERHGGANRQAAVTENAELAANFSEI